MTACVVGASLPGRRSWLDAGLDARLRAAYEANVGRPPNNEVPDAVREQFVYSRRSKYGRALWEQMQRAAG